MKARQKRPDWRRVKHHRSYTVDELARLIGVSKVSIRRWLNAGLPAITDRKPLLILGADLVEFIQGRKAPKTSCQPHECYCVKCREPRRPDGSIAEYMPITATSGNLRAICPDCSALMHRRVSLNKLPALLSVLDISIPQAIKDLMDRVARSPDDHLKGPV